MKYIKKQRAPKSLRDWIKVNSQLPGAEYGTHGFPKDEVRKTLLAEQGHLCAYAMISVAESSCHIEHIKPQERSRAEGAPHETWDYTNLLACYPGNDPEAIGRDEFGATKKGSAWDAHQFVSPLQHSCESRFRYASDGSVSTVKSEDTAAEWTIQTLGLDCSVLCELRRSAIEAMGVSLTSTAAIDVAEAKKLLSEIQKRRSDGSFHAYCTAIEHAAADYLAIIEQRKKKARYASRARTKKGR